MTVSEILQVGAISIDTRSREVLANDSMLSLTRKEYDILEHLVRHAGEVVKREDLFAKLWDYNFDPFSNVVDVHVRNIRKKLHATNLENILETVRGIGYRIHV
jgi:two-component system OmpR family response regulator